MNRLFVTSVALAALAHAQTTEVTESSTQTYPIEVSSRPTDDIPNMSDATAIQTSINESTIAIVISTPLPTIPISSVSNHIPGNNTYSQRSCVTVTAQGEPMFTIQTDTVLETPCTYTVYGGASGTGSGMSGNISSDVLTTTSTMPAGGADTTQLTGTVTTMPSDASAGNQGSETSAPATQSDNPANRVAVGGSGLGLAAFIGALGLL